MRSETINGELFRQVQVHIDNNYIMETGEIDWINAAKDAHGHLDARYGHDEVERHVKAYKGD